MMIRQSLLLGAAFAALAGTGHAQQRPGQSREDLLDAVTRHIQICSEIGDSQGRLACFDKLQTQVGGVQAGPPTPTPLRPGAPPAQANVPPPPAPAGGPPMTGQPIAPPPLNVPGGGTATLGAGGGQVQSGGLPPAPPIGNPDAAYDPGRATSAYQPPDGLMPKPQPTVRRTGPRPVPSFNQPMPNFSLQASDLTYNRARYWQVTVALTSNVNRTLEAQIQCSFLNAGRSVGEAYFGPTAVAPGEQVVTDLIGPPTTAYVDSTTCRLVGQ
jgi:hypothetical protein